MLGVGQGEVIWAGPRPSLGRQPRTHASSSPEGDATFNEEHPQVASANHEQDAAEAKVDEADQDLHRLWEAARDQATELHSALCGPLGRAANLRRSGFPKLVGSNL